MRGDEDKPLSLLEIIWNSKDYGGPEGSHMQIKNVAAIKNSTCKYLKIVHAN